MSPEDGYDSATRDAARHRAFTAHQPGLMALNYQVAGASTQPHKEQRLAAIDTEVDHLLLSDPTPRLAKQLGVRTFNVDDISRYCRALVIIALGRTFVFLGVRSAAGSPAQAVAWTRAQGI